MQQIIIGNKLTPSRLVEHVDFSVNTPYYLCIKRFLSNDIVIPHYADSIEILICDNVEGTFIADHKQYKISGKNVIYVPPSCIHSNNFKKGEGVIYVLKISPEHLQKTVNIERILNSSGNFTINCDPFVCKAFDLIIDEVLSLSKHGGQNIESIKSILNIFSALSPYMNKKNYVDCTLNRNEKNLLLKKLVDFTEKNFLNGLSNKDAASFIGYNENYFCRWFLKMTGMTYSEYIMNLKINYACKLLEDRVPVCEIVEEVGYSNTSFFIKKFKNYMGCTPGNYLKKKENS